MNPKTPISDDQLAALEADIQALYRNRIEEKGATPEGIFWDSEESMRTRFDAALDLAKFEDAAVLDVGCGDGERTLARLDGTRAVGLDFSRRGLELAQQNVPGAALAQGERGERKREEKRKGRMGTQNNSVRWRVRIGS